MSAVASDNVLDGAPEGRRAGKVTARNVAISEAAMALAKAGEWPSPEAVAKRAGISGSVVKRETARLVPARRAWVRKTGRQHPQWRDPDRPGGGTEQADGTAAPDDGEGGDDAARAAAAVVAHDKARRKEEKATTLRRQLREMKRRLAVADELARRQNLGIRPAEIAAILKAGAKNGGTGEAR